MEAIKMTLEEIMQDNWKKVRERFHFPDLPTPKLLDHQDMTACIDMVNHQIMVNENFVEKFHEQGLDYDTIFTGLLAHELNHYYFCPFDLGRSLWIHTVATRVDAQVAPSAHALYIDVVDNLDLIMRRDFSEVGELLRVQEANDPVMQVMKAYYQEATKYGMDVDLESDLDDFQRVQVDRLFTMDFFNQKSEEKNVKRFTRIIRDIVNHYEMDNPNASSLGDFEPKAYDGNQIKKALREVAQKISKEEFDKLVELDGMNDILGDKLSRTAGDEASEHSNRDYLYYQTLAENFRVKLKGKPLVEDDAAYPESYRGFEIDDSVQDVDMFNSLGKPFIPGLGKVRVMKRMKRHTQRAQTPNVLIMKDISGSMNDCIPYAEVACIATANAYLDNQSKVGVYLFDTTVDDTELGKGFQDNTDSIYRGLTKWVGGGTRIDCTSLGKIDEIVNASEKDVDIVLVTDLEITGRKELFDHLYQFAEQGRVTIIYTGSNGGIRELQKEYDNANFNLYQINRPEDIPDVVIGEVNKSIK
jgi:hypothetical protein